MMDSVDLILFPFLSVLYLFKCTGFSEDIPSTGVLGKQKLSFFKKGFLDQTYKESSNDELLFCAL